MLKFNTTKMLKKTAKKKTQMYLQFQNSVVDQVQPTLK